MRNFAFLLLAVVSIVATASRNNFISRVDRLGNPISRTDTPQLPE